MQGRPTKMGTGKKVQGFILSLKSSDDIREVFLVLKLLTVQHKWKRKERNIGEQKIRNQCNPLYKS